MQEGRGHAALFRNAGFAAQEDLAFACNGHRVLDNEPCRLQLVRQASERQVPAKGSALQCSIAPCTPVGERSHASGTPWQPASGQWLACDAA
jgi:hypothetical protein